MAEDDEDGYWREQCVSSKFYDCHSEAVRESYDGHQSYRTGMHRQEYVCDDEAFTFDVGCRKAWFNKDKHVEGSGLHPRTDNGWHLNRVSLRDSLKNNVHLASDSGSNRHFSLNTSQSGPLERSGAHNFNYRVHKHGCNRKSSHSDDHLHDYGKIQRGIIRGQGRGHHFGNGTQHHDDRHKGASRNDDMEIEHSNYKRWKVQSNHGSKHAKNGSFAYNQGMRGRRGHHFLGNYHRVKHKISNCDIVRCTNSNNNSAYDSANVDLVCRSHMDHKSDRRSFREEAPPKIIKGDGSVEGAASNHTSCTTTSPICQQVEAQDNDIAAQKDVPLLCDQMIPKRAFISCNGGTRKRRRSCGVRDFPERSRKVQALVMKKTIIKAKIRNSFVPKGSVSASSVTIMRGSNVQGDPEELPETTERLSSPIDAGAATPDCDFAGPDSIAYEHEASCLQIDGDISGLLNFDCKSSIESTMNIVHREGQLCAESTRNFSKSNSYSCFISSFPEEDYANKGLVPSIPKENNRSGGLVSLDEIKFLEIGTSDCCVEPVRTDHEPITEVANKSVLEQGNPSAELAIVNPDTDIAMSLVTAGNEQVATLKDVNCAQIASGAILPRELDAANDSSKSNKSSAPRGYGFENKDNALKNRKYLTKDIGKGVSINHHASKKLQQKDHIEPIKKMQAFVLSHEGDIEYSSGKMQIESQALERLQEQEPFELTKETGALILYQDPVKDDSNKKDFEKRLHYRRHMSRKLKPEDRFESMKDMEAPVLFQNTNGRNMEKNESKKRLHKGNSRAKLFQNSKSLDPGDVLTLSGLQTSEGLSDRTLVKRTLHEFECIRKALVKSQNAVKRADLEASTLLREKGKWRNCGDKIIGDVPGVEVGDQFSFRMEMLIIGLHRQVQSGIDYIPGTKRSNGSPLATSIVASGGYEDDKDDGNTLIYSGQGGNNSRGSKKQESNQVLRRGNLALSNSMKENTPVRVIRGATDLASPSSKVYIYDGLYDVVNCSFECGAAGFQVYQFTLTRRPGQPQVGLSFLTNLKRKGLSRPHLLLHDISSGQERLPVCVVNEVDQEPAPLHFSYIASIKYPTWYSPIPSQGCQCHGNCNEETCSCAIKNGGEFPYNEKGYILRDKNIVYECGPSCSCSSSCQNRVTQKGLRYRLEIFKTTNRGWGVRSLDSIQPGGFICEYTGELLSDAEAEQRVENDEYLFDLGNGCNPSCNLLDTEDGASETNSAADDISYTIDAKDMGNVARFINHSCSPNLYAQNVLFDSDDLRFPHVMLIAMENIPPMRELTYDYNYTLDTVRDADGKVKVKACYCGAQDCQGRLY